MFSPHAWYSLQLDMFTMTCESTSLSSLWMRIVEMTGLFVWPMVSGCGENSATALGVCCHGIRFVQTA